MMKLITGSRFCLLQVLDNGPYLGLTVHTSSLQEHPPNWFQDVESLVETAAGIIKKYTDQGYFWPGAHQQLDLFAPRETHEGLFHVEPPPVHPYLKRAHAQSGQHGTTLKCHKAFAGSACFCPKCQCPIPQGTILFYWLIPTNGGKSLSISCDECHPR